MIKILLLKLKTIQAKHLQLGAIIDILMFSMGKRISAAKTWRQYADVKSSNIASTFIWHFARQTLYVPMG
jgi:hypothetical protein